MRRGNVEMAIPVNDLMKLGVFNQCKLISGLDGGRNEVKYVTVMEVPEIVKWLRGHELILTSLYSIKDDIEAQNTIVRDLHNVGSAALAIKLHPSMDKIPDMIIEESNKYSLPIIEVTNELTYIDIIVQVMNNIINQHTIVQQNFDQVNHMLNEVAVNAKGMNELVESISYLTKNFITVESEYSYIDVPDVPFKYQSLTKKQKEKLIVTKRPTKLVRKCNNREMDCVVAPVFLDRELCGNITSWGFHGDQFELDQAILERASSLITQEFVRLKVQFDIEQQYKDEYLRDLLQNHQLNEGDLVERGSKHNFFTDKYHVCLAFIFEDTDKINRDKISRALSTIEVEARKIQNNVFVGYYNKHIVTIYSMEKEDSLDNAALIFNIQKLHKGMTNIENIDSDFHIGIGRSYKGLKGLRKSYNEATKAAKLGKTILNHSVIHYNNLGLFQLLSNFDNDHELGIFYDETIHRIHKYNQESDLDLINTLMVYFKNNESLTKTANELFIHVNTLKYRIKKINQISGYDLNNSEEKLQLYLGLKIHYLREIKSSV